MTTLNVLFSDNTNSTVVGYFASPPNTTDYANLGTVADSDPKWAAYYKSLPWLLQQGLPLPTAA